MRRTTQVVNPEAPSRSRAYRAEYRQRPEVRFAKTHGVTVKLAREMMGMGCR